MKDVDKFYQKSKLFNKPSGLLKGFFNMGLDKELKEKKAIELGAGIGNDAEFLINKGFDVTCIDKEVKSKEAITNRINNTEKLHFVLNSFENIKLHKVNLIYSCFSLHFCNPNNFNDLMNEITKNIEKGGYFVGNFLGEEDEWRNKTKMTFVSKQQLLDYFKEFEIIYYAEKKYIKESVTQKGKKWHVYEIYARKLK